MQSLKQLREEKGVKQVAVASHLGISRQCYSKLENNQDKMTVGRLEMACDFLGIPTYKIFLGEDVRETNVE